MPAPMSALDVADQLLQQQQQQQQQQLSPSHTAEVCFVLIVLLNASKLLVRH